MQMRRTKVDVNFARAAEQDPSSNRGVHAEDTRVPLPAGPVTTFTQALVSGQIPSTKPAVDRRKPTVARITKAKSDLEELYARVSPLLSHDPAGARYFSDELWRILEVLGRIKMTLSSGDLPERA
jgi:hypothetical protein